MTASQEDINSIMKRLRARLYSMIETLDFSSERQNALKQSIKDSTGMAWNDLTNLFKNSV
jgi:hypothetical protein